MGFSILFICTVKTLDIGWHRFRIYESDLALRKSNRDFEPSNLEFIFKLFFGNFDTI